MFDHEAYERYKLDCLKRGDVALNCNDWAKQFSHAKPFERYPGEALEKPGKCYDNGNHPTVRAARDGRVWNGLAGVHNTPQPGCTCDVCAAVAPPIACQADREYESRIDAERVTAEFKTKSTRRLDAGRKPITESLLARRSST
jgi:hypothetical protein